MFKGKRVLVAGGTGTIGIPLVKLLEKEGAEVTVVSMDAVEYARKVLGRSIKFEQLDLTDRDNCMRATKGQECVFNLVGIKGSVGIGQSKVASYFYPMIMFQTHLMESAYRNDVGYYLFVSSICGYPQSSEPKKEETMWEGMPKQNDRIPGLVKRIGEIQAETYQLEHGWEGVKIVRPSNVFGPFDDFDPATAQVIPALIARMAAGENPVRVWGDGLAVRDFIFSDDCAYWIAEAIHKAPACTPINIGGGRSLSIKEVAETIAGCMPTRPEIQWDANQPAGDPVRALDVTLAEKLIGFKTRTTFEEGIRRTTEWHLKDCNGTVRKQGE